jgi:hypothetical protein
MCRKMKISIKDPHQQTTKHPENKIALKNPLIFNMKKIFLKRRQVEIVKT